MEYIRHLSPELITEFEQAMGLALQKMRGLNKQKKIQEETELVIVPENNEGWKLSLLSSGLWSANRYGYEDNTFSQLDQILTAYGTLTQIDRNNLLLQSTLPTLAEYRELSDEELLANPPNPEKVVQEYIIDQGNFLLYGLIELLREKARELR